MMFYENRKNMIFKVLSSVVYCIINNYVYDDYLCCQKAKLKFSNKGLKKNIQWYFRNRNSRNINEHHFMSWICEIWKVNRHIFMLYKIGLLLSIKRFFYSWKTFKWLERCASTRETNNGSRNLTYEWFTNGVIQRKPFGSWYL